MEFTTVNAHDKVSIGASILAALTAAWVNFPPAILTLIAMMALDYFSGLVAAGSKGELSAAKAKQGIWRKSAQLIAGISGYVISSNIPHIAIGGAELPINIGSAICGAFIIAEFISILENVGGAGIALPKAITDILANLKR